MLQKGHVPWARQPKVKNLNNNNNNNNNNNQNKI